MQDRTKKIIGAIVIAGLGFFVGYEATPYINMWIEKRKQRKEAITKAEEQAAQIKNSVATLGVMVEPEIIEDANGIISLVIPVADEKAKGMTEKFLSKNNIKGVTVVIK